MQKVTKTPKVKTEVEVAGHIIKAIASLRPKKACKTPKQKSIKRVVHRVVSDNHIGSDIDGRETGSYTFGLSEELRRTAAVTMNVVEYKTRHRDHTALVVYEIGDNIQNQLHDPRDGAALAVQCFRYLSLRSQDYMLMAQHYGSVDVYCSPGNHGRFTARHKEKAVDQKWDSLETVLHYALAKICASQPNIRFHIPFSPYVTFSSLGHHYFATHGDTTLNVGAAGRSIDINKAESATNKFNSRLKGARYDVFCMGHVHVATHAMLANGVRLITNGALCPADPYAVSINIPASACSQTLFEATEQYAVGDYRIIDVGPSDDNNAALDIFNVPDFDRALSIL